MPIRMVELSTNSEFHRLFQALTSAPAFNDSRILAVSPLAAASIKLALGDEVWFSFVRNPSRERTGAATLTEVSEPINASRKRGRIEVVFVGLVANPKSIVRPVEKRSFEAVVTLGLRLPPIPV